MLNDFTKINTFLTVVSEKSFSKASQKLNISQPAVTQHIKFIEKYLDTPILIRSKNSFELTRDGEILLGIAKKLSNSILLAKDELSKITSKNQDLIIGASRVIGDYILPLYLNKIKDKIDNNINVKVTNSSEAIEDLLEKRLDIALIESPIIKDGIIYKEWFSDEIVIFSNQKLPLRITNKDLKTYRWICREENSHTRQLFQEYLDLIKFDDCNRFNIISESSSLTTVLQTVLHSKQDDIPIVSIASYQALKQYELNGKLFISRLPKTTMKRVLYIAYLKKHKYNKYINDIVKYLCLL